MDGFIQNKACRLWIRPRHYAVRTLSVQVRVCVMFSRYYMWTRPPGTQGHQVTHIASSSGDDSLGSVCVCVCVCVCASTIVPDRAST